LRKLARAKLARENPGPTLQPTALVHEAYLRLVGLESNLTAWDGRGHFFAEQVQPVRRKVALKVIKAGMDTKEVVGRFDPLLPN